MNKQSVDYTLYLCTDRDLMRAESVEQSVEQAILGGATLVQLREKTLSSRAFYEAALAVKRVTDAHNVPLLINDRLDIAQAVDAAGVHLGQSDLPCATARRILGEDKIIGISAHTVQLAVRAQQEGADYLGVGAMVATGTKTDAEVTTREELQAILAAVKLPVVVIGGIGLHNIGSFAPLGVSGAAVISAIVAQDDIAGAARLLKARFLGEQA